MEKNQLVVAGSAEVSSKLFDGGTVRAAGVLTELGNLVSSIEDVTCRELLGELDLTNDRILAETIIEGRL